MSHSKELFLHRALPLAGSALYVFSRSGRYERKPPLLSMATGLGERGIHASFNEHYLDKEVILPSAIAQTSTTL